MLQVLVDADNVAPRRLQPVLTLLGTVTDDLRLTASGSQHALDALRWPPRALGCVRGRGKGELVGGRK